MGITNRKWCARRVCPKGVMTTGAKNGQSEEQWAVKEQMGFTTITLGEIFIPRGRIDFV